MRLRPDDEARGSDPFFVRCILRASDAELDASHAGMLARDEHNVDTDVALRARAVRALGEAVSVRIKECGKSSRSLGSVPVFATQQGERRG